MTEATHPLRLTTGQAAVLAVYAADTIGAPHDLGLSFGTAERLRYLRCLEATNPRTRGRRVYRITEAGRVALARFMERVKP